MLPKIIASIISFFQNALPCKSVFLTVSNIYTSVNSLGIVLFMLVLSPNAKDLQLTLSVFRLGIQLVYPYSTTTMYSSDAAS